MSYWVFYEAFCEKFSASFLLCSSSPAQLTLHNITITLLSLRLDIAGVGILDAIVEGVFGIGHRLRMHSMGQHWGMMHLQQRWTIVTQLNWHSLGGGKQQSNGNKVLYVGVCMCVGVEEEAENESLLDRNVCYALSIFSFFFF